MIKNQSGKITISSLIFFFLIFYAGYAAYRLIMVEVTQRQIKADIIDKFGIRRGPEFEVATGEKMIRQLLDSHDNITYDEKDSGVIHVFIKGDKIHWEVKYTIHSDFLFFKREKDISLVDQMTNHD